MTKNATMDINTSVVFPLDNDLLRTLSLTLFCRGILSSGAPICLSLCILECAVSLQDSLVVGSLLSLEISLDEKCLGLSDFTECSSPSCELEILSITCEL